MAGPQTDAPIGERWAVAAVTFMFIRDLDGAEFRDAVAQLALVLNGEGLTAHRCADRLEGRSIHPTEPSPADHTRDAIVARVSQQFSYEQWRIAERYFNDLAADGLDDPNLLRQQAATVLDAAEIINWLLDWYAQRIAVLYDVPERGRLLNDTIARTMFEWGVYPTEMHRQLAENGVTGLTVAGLTMALKRYRDLGETGNEPIEPWRIILLPE